MCHPAPVGTISGARAAATGRRAPESDELQQLVETQIRAWIAAQRIFTAYGVTRELRAAHAHLELAHEEINPLVHGFMRAARAEGGAAAGWGLRWATYGGRQAQEYIPPYLAAAVGEQEAGATPDDKVYEDDEA